MADRLVIDVLQVERARLALGLMRTELQRKAGISFATLSRVYGGKTVSWRTLRGIASALRVSNPMRIVKPDDKPQAVAL